MTKLKVGIISAVVVAGVTVPLVMHHRAQTELREAQESLRQQREQLTRMAVENERLANLVGRASTPPQPVASNASLEVLRLRGEVGRLRQETSEAARKTNGPSALSGLTANPEVLKLIRDQQKAGMSILYKDFTNRLNLLPDQAEKLSDLLADNVMENIDQITAVLRDKKSPEEMNQVFTAQDAALLEKVQALLGPEGLAQYQEYTRNLASHLTAEQFKGKLTGDQAAKDEKAKQLYQLMQEEAQSALASAGLGADFQIIPMLNFRNIASAEEAEKNLKFLDAIYERVTGRASSFLTPEEIQKFGEFRKTAINGNRTALLMNRKMMAPSP